MNKKGFRCSGFDCDIFMQKDYYEKLFPPYSNHVVSYLFRDRKYIPMNESIRFISKGQMVSQ